MFNPFRRQESCEKPKPDKVADQLNRVRWNAEQCLQAHVQSKGLNMLNKDAVRNALLYAHMLEESLEAYEREIRARDLERSLADTAFTPKPELETSDA